VELAGVPVTVVSLTALQSACTDTTAEFARARVRLTTGAVVVVGMARVNVPTPALPRIT